MTDAPIDPRVPLSVFAASTETDPQPPSRVLDAVRERRFTGELAFRTDPPTTVYCDDGVAYFAERHDGTTLTDRLREAGVVDDDQLRRGVVHVGEVEHVGRLFDRDETVDRDAVMVVVEATTDRLVSELAAHDPLAVDITAYRHHPSGLHRWFMPARSEGPLSPRSFDNDAATWSGSTGATTTTADFGSPEVRIEWDLPLTTVFSETQDPSFVDTIDLDAATEADESPTSPTAPEWPSGFQIVWPDGTHEPADVEAPSEPLAPPHVSTPDVDGTASATESAVTGADHHDAPPSASGDAADDDGVTRDVAERPGDGPVSFDMPTIGADHGPSAREPIPDEVVDAVRRALAAIENASAAPTELPTIDLDPIAMPPLRMPTFDLPPPVPSDEATHRGASSTTPDLSVSPSDPVPGRSDWLAAPTPDMLVAADADRLDAPVTSSVDASTAAATETRPADTTQTVHDGDALAHDHVGTTADDRALPAPGAAAPASPFAPPSLATLAAPDPAAATDVIDVTGADHASVAAPVEEHGRASVVFVEDQEPATDQGSTGDDSRRSALRRLIGSLRRSA